jgi:hypothetical protein
LEALGFSVRPGAAASLARAVVAALQGIASASVVVVGVVASDEDERSYGEGADVSVIRLLVVRSASATQHGRVAGEVSGPCLQRCEDWRGELMRTVRLSLTYKPNPRPGGSDVVADSWIRRDEQAFSACCAWLDRLPR